MYVNREKWRSLKYVMSHSVMKTHWLFYEQKAAKKGNGVNHASAQRGSSLVTIPGDRIHIECRRSYCKAENIVRDNVIPFLQQPQIKHNLRTELQFSRALLVLWTTN